MKSNGYTLISACIAIFIIGFWPLVLSAQDDVRWHENVVQVKISESALSKLELHKTDGLTLTGIKSLDDINRLAGVTEITQIIRTDPRFAARHAKYGLNRWFEFRYTSNKSELDVIEMFKTNPNVEVAERKYMYKLPEVEVKPIQPKLSPLEGSNDPFLHLQWALYNYGQQDGTPGADINMFPAWDITTGSSDVIVKVIDTGIDINHLDLVSNLWINPYPGPENGYDGDVHGWNFSTNTGDVQDSGVHGTHVSGTIAASTNNEIGVAGVAGGFGDIPGVRIMTANVSNPVNGFWDGNIPEAFVYGSDNGAVISNNSWTGPAHQLLTDAINYFIDTAGYDAEGNPVGPIQGGVVIFAAGNGNNDVHPGPSNAVPRVITVGSTDRNDLRSSFSNYGDWISVSAPGSQIASTFPNNQYAYLWGTSMAAPHVAGVAALIASYMPGLTNDEVRARIIAGVDNINDQNPDYVGLLGGRINAFKALLMSDPRTPPTTITDLETVGHIAEDHVWLQLTVPDVGGEFDKPYRYDIRLSEQLISVDNFHAALKVNELTSPLFSGMTQAIKIGGLTPQTTYYVAIKTSDAFGNESEISNIVSFTTDGSPRILLSDFEFVYELNFGEITTQTTEIQNTGEGTLFFSFPFHFQKSSPIKVAISPLSSQFYQYNKSEKLNSSLARNAIKKFRSENYTEFNKAEESVVSYYNKYTTRPANGLSSGSSNEISSKIEFEELTLEGQTGLIVAEDLYSGLLTEIVPDFILEENGADFWASDLALVFISRDTNMPVLQIGGYNVYAPIIYPWLNGDSEDEGTPVNEPIILEEGFDVSNMDAHLVNSYSPGFSATATWSGKITLIGVTEDDLFITEITPASGSLLPGESVEITFTIDASVTGNNANITVLRSNDLSNRNLLINSFLNVARVITWANLEGPAIHSMDLGETFEIHGQVFAELFTHQVNPSSEIIYQVGFHDTDSDPATWPDDAWVDGSFYELAEENHLYMASTGDHLTEGIWFYATRFNFMSEGFTYGGYSESGGGIWDGIENISGELTVQTTVSTGYEPDLPQTVVLDQNYPNPFNPTTQIRFGLPETADVRLEVYNITGQRVATLVNGKKSAGYHTVTFNALNLSSGVYLYRLSTNASNTVSIQKMTLIK